MKDKQTQILIDALPLLSKISGGYSTLTDSKGMMITNYDYNGKELHGFKGQIYDMAIRCLEQEKPLLGSAHYDKNSTALAIPIGQNVLVTTDTQRILNEQNLKIAITNALPHISKIVGGQVSIYNRDGKHICGQNSNGEEITISKTCEKAKQAIETMTPIVDISTKIAGVHFVYIPITDDCCLVLNDESAIIKSKKLLNEVMKLQNTRYSFADIIGQSDSLQETISKCKKTANSHSTLMLVGETGTGKELFAQSIHNFSRRREHQFIAVNCAALPPTLIESHLFGYEEGAFTGSKKGGMAGCFEQAKGGTIFLDEISEMDLNAQTKLLRVIQEKQVTRVGGTKPIDVDVRIICATNKNLSDMVEAKQFREDLYYRIHVINIPIPPLREREGDIPILINHFLEKYNYTIGKSVKSIDGEALQALEKFNWPGNIRELENSIEYAVNMVDFNEDTLKLHHLPKHISLLLHVDKPVIDNLFDSNNKTLKDYVEEYEKKIIQQAMKASDNNNSLIAEQLGLSTSTLWRKMKRYGLL